MIRAVLFLSLGLVSSAHAAGLLKFSNSPQTPDVPVTAALLKRNGNVEITCKLKNGLCPGIDAIKPTPSLLLVSVPLNGGDVVLNFGLGGGTVCKAGSTGPTLATFWAGKLIDLAGTGFYGPVASGSYTVNLTCYNHAGAGTSQSISFQVP